MEIGRSVNLRPVESGKLPRTLRWMRWLVEPRHQKATGIEPVFASSSLEIVHRPCPLIGKISEGTRVDVEHGLLVVTDGEGLESYPVGKDRVGNG